MENIYVVVAVVLAVLIICVALYLHAHHVGRAAPQAQPPLAPPAPPVLRGRPTEEGDESLHEKVDDLRHRIEIAPAVAEIKRGIDGLHKRWDRDDEKEKRDRQDASDGHEKGQEKT